MRKEIKKKNIKKKLHSSRFMSRDRGFSLVESLVAITVLTVAIAGPMTIAQKGLSAANFAKDQVTAFQLGQEAMEFVRYTRDTNKLKGSSNWLDGLSSGSSNCIGNLCTVDTINETIKKCPGSGCENLKIDPITGLYGHNSSWTDSKFKREFIITEIVPAVEVAVDVTVSWTTGIISKQIKLQENIFNWQ